VSTWESYYYYYYYYYYYWHKLHFFAYLSLYEAVSPFPVDRGLCLITWPLPTACFPPVAVAASPDGPVSLQHAVFLIISSLKASALTTLSDKGGRV
jgi:hypothetical protein